MATRDINNFNFWCPVEISKAIDEKTGEEIMLLGGIASTADEDSDGEFLDPKGFDIKPLLESGMVNWHHQAKTCPGTIVGEPTKAEIRKEGLYIETKLYPSSPVARDIWELAKTLESDSDTRRLGYSIEGRVLERGSNDKTKPGYKKITKAVITGVAITHQPKNPKTFANIIKGDIDDDFEKEETEETDSKKKTSKEEKKYYEGIGINDKSLDTDSARPLIKEEVDPKVKVVTFGKAEIMEKLFQDITGISIEKANDIYILIKNISKMKKKAMVTEEDIAKAYDALGISPESISKGEDNQDSDTDDEDVEDEEEEEDEDDDEAVKKAKTKKSADSDDEEDEDDDEAVKKAKTKKSADSDDEEEEDYDEDVEDDEEDEDDDEAVKKAQIFGRFDRLEKAMAISHLNESKYIKALGVMVKAQSDDLSKAIDSLNLANDKIDEQNEVIKAQTETISALQERLEEFGSGVPAPKSVRHSNPVERTFGKGQDNDFEKGGDGTNKISIKNRAAVSEVLDQATFQKGFDNEFSNACTAFEANGTLSSNVITRLKTEYGIEIVQ